MMNTIGSARRANRREAVAQLGEPTVQGAEEEGARFGIYLVLTVLLLAAAAGFAGYFGWVHPLG